MEEEDFRQGEEVVHQACAVPLPRVGTVLVAEEGWDLRAWPWAHHEAVEEEDPHRIKIGFTATRRPTDADRRQEHTMDPRIIKDKNSPE